MNATVSVIIPAFNSAQTIGRAVSSVMSQTYTDIEIIVINDGSTDKTKEICQEFENQDSRIKIINQSQLGPGPARNAGLDVAKGEYVYFMDSDDEIDMDLIHEFLSAAKQLNDELIIHMKYCQGIWSMYELAGLLLIIWPYILKKGIIIWKMSVLSFSNFHYIFKFSVSVAVGLQWPTQRAKGQTS